ncbi:MULTISPECIES: ABC transporter substrate-binding protein [Rahnella]|uniref:ABC transporter substrate-binding protein n=1 Tax=Rahnella laticis TaxID=2787622 RepID=A0ABS0E0P6_9GAMM|nr:MULTISPECIES: ABC transporter substrate-binding protein [Rahnella]MBF7978668.1 ABC transporter substrate-binding protein [Rahnella laticis]MBF7998758.1 ABC transporter substrate-binding protein [Rahnella sp. LAC-M12]
MSALRLSPLAGLLSAALLLTGCFNEADKTTENSADSRLRLAMLQPPRSGLTPLSDDAFKLSRWSTAETLVVLDKLGEAQPALATKWQQTGENSWRLGLRHDVKFHDGTSLDAAAVVNSLTVAARAAPKPRILDGVQLAAVADGEHAVIITTAQPDPLLPQRLSSPQLAILSQKAYSASGVVNPRHTGSGPFELVQVDGTSSARLERFDGYWGEKAKASGIDVSFVPDGTARGAALRTGTADIVEAIPVSQAPLLDQRLIHEVPMPRTNTLYLNTRLGVMQDPALRAAVREAINRQQLVDNVYEKRADVAQGLLGPALPWAAQLRHPVAHPAAARKPAGETITLATFSDRAELPEVAVYLAQQLTAAGFTVKQVVREYSQIETDALAGKFDAFILSRATVLDSGDPVAYLYSDFSCKGSFNIAQLCRPEIDEALQHASVIPAGEARRKAIMLAENQILATDAAIPMLHERVIQGEAANVSDALRDPRERTLINAATQRNSQAD